MLVVAAAGLLMACGGPTDDTQKHSSSDGDPLRQSQPKLPPTLPPLSALPLPPGPVTPPPVEPPPPTPFTLDDARLTVTRTMDAAQQIELAMRVFGLLPSYACGEPRALVGQRFTDALRVKSSCIGVTASSTATEDVIALDFGPSGCVVDGHRLSGRATLALRGGDDRVEVELDLRQARFDDVQLASLVGVGKCGDEKRAWVRASGPIAPGASYAIDVRVGLRDGLPLIGGKTLVVDGTLALVTAAGPDSVTFTALEYDVGEKAPKKGALCVLTSSGHLIEAKFDTLFWRLGDAQIRVDGGAWVTVPVLR